MTMTPALNPSDYYDLLETRSPEEREAALMQRLAKQVQHAKQHTPAYQHRFHGLHTRVRHQSSIPGGFPALVSMKSTS
ncbi:MAG: phenylacetate--CoA ligase [Rhizobacter sp.]